VAACFPFAVDPHAVDPGRSALGWWWRWGAASIPDPERLCRRHGWQAWWYMAIGCRRGKHSPDVLATCQRAQV